MQAIAVALILLSLAVLAAALWLRKRSGLPWAPIRADDVGGGRRLERPLYSQRYGLTGRPDYLIEGRDGPIPVELKPGRRASRPYDSDLMQLAAYCLLVEETVGRPPPYGLLRYAEHSFRLDYTPAVRADLLATLDEMRALLAEDDAERSHDDPRRCAGCGFVEICEEALA